jgi:hypothetical protein
MLCEDALHFNKVGVALIMQRFVTCCNVRPVSLIEPLVMVWGLLEPSCVAGKEWSQLHGQAEYFTVHTEVWFWGPL